MIGPLALCLILVMLGSICTICCGPSAVGLVSKDLCCCRSAESDPFPNSRIYFLTSILVEIMNWPQITNNVTGIYCLLACILFPIFFFLFLIFLCNWNVLFSACHLPCIYLFRLAHLNGMDQTDNAHASSRAPALYMRTHKNKKKNVKAVLQLCNSKDSNCKKKEGRSRRATTKNFRALLALQDDDGRLKHFPNSAWFSVVTSLPPSAANVSN